jgi:hypothetical protein
MARPRRNEPPAPAASGLIASAIRLPKVTAGRVVNGESWQAAAWAFYDSCPELRFVANWVGNVMSRAELLTVHEQGRDDKTISEGPAWDALHAYFDGQHGQAEMLRQTGIHLTVAGECYHYFHAAEQEWHVLAVGKVRQVGSGKSARITAEWDGVKHDVTKDDIVIRVWNPHPMDPGLADSPTRANLDVLSEIEACSKHINATLVSRLAGAGVLFVPQDITFPIPANMDPQASSADVFMQVLGEAMMTPIKEPGSASAVVPVVVQAPGDSLSQIKHMTFWSELDTEVKGMREAAVKRFALGMDVPPEVLLGMAEANHWNAWLVDEASVKAHTEPRLAVVTNAITTAYLWPALDGEVEEHRNWAIVADTSNLRLRPNRSREAIELYDRGELTAEALRRETGFEQEDKPERKEFMEWLLRKIALGSTSPEQTQAAIQALGVPLDVQPGDLGTGQERDPAIDNIRSLDDHPSRTVAPVDGEVPESLLAACDVLVYRALERAGNRIKTKNRYKGKEPAADLYLSFASEAIQVPMLLDDAWSCADRVLNGQHEAFVPLLHTYTQMLLQTQTPHTRDLLRTHLSTAPLEVVG